MEGLSINTVTYTLEDSLQRQRVEFQGLCNRPYFSRAKEAELLTALGSSLIKIVLGPRRAGKSRLIQKILEDKKIAYLNFDDETFRGVSGDALMDAAHKVYPDADFWYLDEIQDFPDWETFVNKLHRRNYNLVLTGSNAKLLSTELATALTGRHVAIELLPFSFEEYINATSQIPSWTNFQFYLERGGYPEVLFQPAIDARSYLSTLFDSIVLKDLVKRKKIRNPSYLTNTLSLLVNNVASRTSSRSLSKALHGSPSVTSVDKYLHYFEEAYLVETIGAFSFKTKARIQSERKPYVIDTGILGALSALNMPILSKQLENCIYLTLRGRRKIQNLSLFYYRSDSGKEIDFLIREGHRTTDLIQVCLNMSSEETRQREVSALLQAQKIFADANLLIITANEAGSIRVDSKTDIQLVPAHVFCSNKGVF
ncbi:MAG: ATP-binding protein [Pseudomonadota bacterium]